MAILGWILCVLATIQIGRLVFGGFMRRVVETQQARQRVTEIRDRIRALQQQPAVPVAKEVAWEGSRKFRVHRKIAECEGCHSYYLVPHDGKPLPPFLPGQYLTLQVRLPGESKTTSRCYSLSDRPDRTYYRCTIKSVAGNGPERPPGRVSNYLNSHLREGEILDVKAPRGTFALDTQRCGPVVLIGAGIGVTPLLSMLNALIETATSVVFAFGVRNSREHPFKRHLEAIRAQQMHVRMVIAYSQPLEFDRQGLDYDYPGRLEFSRIERWIPADVDRFFICGPKAFTVDMVESVKHRGFPLEKIQTEAFGPSSLPTPKARPVPPTDSSDGRITVRFDRSQKELEWRSDAMTLLDFAERHGIAIDSGCRAGSCGSCVTSLRSGRVQYSDEPDYDCGDGECLPCMCVPTESLVLDA